jgi:hypothetical protein
MSETTHPQPNGTLLAAAEADESTPPATGMLELARPECLRLLAATGIGRVVVSVPGWEHPLIRPVNYGGRGVECDHRRHLRGDYRRQ